MMDRDVPALSPEVFASIVNALADMLIRNGPTSDHISSHCTRRERILRIFSSWLRGVEVHEQLGDRVLGAPVVRTVALRLLP